MQSNNPVFARNDAFNGRGGAVTSTDPSQWKVDLDGGQGTTSPTHTERGQGRMTLDTVVEKTAISLGLLIIAAGATWFFIGDLGDIDTGDSAFQTAGALAMGGALLGLVLSLVNSFKKIISPALVIAFAVVEGVFVGAFSKLVAAYVGEPSIVFQAVLATMVAFAGTLAAYKFFNIQVTDKFRRVVTIAMFSFVGVILLNFVLSLTGVVDAGLRGFNTLGLVVSAIAVVLAVFMLILDFDFVEKGVAAGLPERESWRAAFGLTVTLVWLYIELLRILAILRGSD